MLHENGTQTPSNMSHISITPTALTFSLFFRKIAMNYYSQFWKNWRVHNVGH